MAIHKKFIDQFINVSSKAALSASYLVGKKDKIAADKGAVDPMRRELNKINMEGTVVIGEGEMDEAPMLYIGEKLGTLNGPKFDIAVDPLEGTKFTANGESNAFSVLAISEQGGLLSAPDTYMEKIVIGANLPKNLMDLDNEVEKNIELLAEAKKKKISDLRACVLKRPRHDHIVKELNKLKGIEKITSTATQDFGVLKIEFDFAITPKEAKRAVEEALTDARSTKTFAQDLPVEPTIQEIDVNEFPIINVNLSGEYPVDILKEKADLIKDKLEAISEINAVDIRGVQEKKVKIEIRKFDAEANRISFSDVESAIQGENTTIGAGNLQIDGVDNFIIIDGKFKDFKDLDNLVVKHENNDNPDSFLSPHGKYLIKKILSR